MLVVFRFLEGRQTEQECFYVAVGGEEVEGDNLTGGSIRQERGSSFKCEKNIVKK